MTNNIPDHIVNLAGKLNVAVETLWAALIRQAPISSTVELIGLLALMASTVIGARFLYKWVKNEDNDPDHPFVIVSGCVMLVMVAVTLFLIPTELPRILAGFFNPEYWALKEIIK